MSPAPMHERGWTQWTRILEVEVDADALRELAAADVYLQQPGAPQVRWPSTQGPGWIRFDLPRRRMSPPRALHFDLDSQPVVAWGCHRSRSRDRLVVGPGFFVSSLMWWALPAREAAEVVHAAGGRVLRQAGGPHD